MNCLPLYSIWTDIRGSYNNNTIKHIGRDSKMLKLVVLTHEYDLKYQFYYCLGAQCLSEFQSQISLKINQYYFSTPVIMFSLQTFRCG